MPGDDLLFLFFFSFVTIRKWALAEWREPNLDKQSADGKKQTKHTQWQRTETKFEHTFSIICCVLT